VIYPIYLNANATIQQGRKIPKLYAANNPTIHDITDACRRLNLPHTVEPNKCFPRNFYQVGRIRIQILDDNEKPLNPTIMNRHGLLVAVGSMINKRKNQNSPSNESK
jgi:signal recognition particle subunit SRP19